jgi:predicted GIY-YIG superfamily endonuclease
MRNHLHIYYVYGLCDRENNIRYIGVAHNVNIRFREHLSKASRGKINPVHVWIRNQNYYIHYTILDILPKHEAFRKEREYIKTINNLLNRNKYQTIHVIRPPPID